MLWALNMKRIEAGEYVLKTASAAEITQKLQIVLYEKYFTMSARAKLVGQDLVVKSAVDIVIKAMESEIVKARQRLAASEAKAAVASSEAAAVGHMTEAVDQKHAAAFHEQAAAADCPDEDESVSVECGASKAEHVTEEVDEEQAQGKSWSEQVLEEAARRSTEELKACGAEPQETSWSAGVLAAAAAADEAATGQRQVQFDDTDEPPRGPTLHRQATGFVRNDDLAAAAECEGHVRFADAGEAPGSSTLQRQATGFAREDPNVAAEQPLDSLSEQLLVPDGPDSAVDQAMNAILGNVSASHALVQEQPLESSSQQVLVEPDHAKNATSDMPEPVDPQSPLSGDDGVTTEAESKSASLAQRWRTGWQSLMGRG
eukprot:gnl/TRDRNA2_/TRDRNA2_142305_c1_seq1.p1 gnl/TRDRNA2_/TRDRNA2_142305_c1~~gnl/TRDRNA2_/TRDRNA2_142305_c1_seq1.p1  ORF type:complete len:373 (+),score=90.07 gnl/TRDRNA2_/TRDRNA2_142305_c1_seq1:2-1120(+)